MRNTVGPNLAVYASDDAAELTISGHLEAEVALARWEIRQTYPENAKYPPEAVQRPDYDGTQTIGKPSFDASVTATGEVSLHLKPTVEFGIVFDERWGVDKCTVDLVLDGYAIAHAKSVASTSSDNSYPFSYGIDAGSNIYAALNAPEVYGWGGRMHIPIASAPRKQLTTETCPSGSEKRRPIDEIDPLTGEYLPSFVYIKQRSNSSPSPSKKILDQIIKRHYLALHGSTLLAKENADYHTANEKKRQKRNRSSKQIPCEKGLTVEKGLQLAQQLKLLDEAIQIDSHTQSELPN